MLESRRVLLLGPPNLSTGRSVLVAQGSHEGDGGLQYHATRRLQAAVGVQYHVTRRSQAAVGVQYHVTRRSQAAVGVQYHVTRRLQAAVGVQYHVTRRLQAAGPHGDDGVQHRAMGWDQTAASRENGGGRQ